MADHITRLPAAVPTPEGLLLALAELYTEDPEGIGVVLAQIADAMWDARMALLIGITPGAAIRDRDEHVTDLLDRIAPAYTAAQRGAAA